MERNVPNRLLCQSGYVHHMSMDLAMMLLLGWRQERAGRRFYSHTDRPVICLTSEHQNATRQHQFECDEYIRSQPG